jgi:hypothetical protein
MAPPAEVLPREWDVLREHQAAAAKERDLSLHEREAWLEERKAREQGMVEREAAFREREVVLRQREELFRERETYLEREREALRERSKMLHESLQIVARDDLSLKTEIKELNTMQLSFKTELRSTLQDLGAEMAVSRDGGFYVIQDGIRSIQSAIEERPVGRGKGANSPHTMASSEGGTSGGAGAGSTTTGNGGKDHVKKHRQEHDLNDVPELVESYQDTGGEVGAALRGHVLCMHVRR